MSGLNVDFSTERITKMLVFAVQTGHHKTTPVEFYNNDHSQERLHHINDGANAPWKT